MTATDRIPDPLDTPSRARLWHSGGFWTLIAMVSWFLFVVPCCGACGSIEFMPVPGSPPPGVPFEPWLSVRVDPAEPQRATIAPAPRVIEPGVYWVHFDPTVSGDGLLSPTRARGPTVITSFQYTSIPGVPPGIAPSVLAVVAAESPRLSADFRAAVAAGGTVERVLWAGYAQNALLLLFGCSALFATGRCAALMVGEVTSRRRHLRGTCSNCGYELHGLPARTFACPECGHGLGVAAPSPRRSGEV